MYILNIVVKFVIHLSQIHHFQPTDLIKIISSLGFQVVTPLESPNNKSEGFLNLNLDFPQ